jgi:hypothetical protein
MQETTPEDPRRFLWSERTQNGPGAEVVRNLEKTYHYLEHTTDEQGLNHVTTTTEDMDRNLVMDHIENNDYCIFCLPEPNSNQEVAVGHNLKYSNNCIDGIQKYLELLEERIKKVCLIWVEVMNYPGMRSIYLIEPFE